jgi:hypothetical protein
LDTSTEKYLLLITESNDKSAENVIDWLNHYNIRAIRKNTEQDYSDFKIEILESKIDSSLKNHTVWNRR